MEKEALLSLEMKAFKHREEEKDRTFSYGKSEQVQSRSMDGSIKKVENA